MEAVAAVGSDRRHVEAVLRAGQDSPRMKGAYATQWQRKTPDQRSDTSKGPFLYLGQWGRTAACPFRLFYAKTLYYCSS